VDVAGVTGVHLRREASVYHESVRAFFSDPVVAERILRRSRPEYAERAGTFIATVGAFGIARSRVFFDGFAVFEHEGLAAAIESFIGQAPSAELPLEAITVIQYARHDACAEDLAETCTNMRKHAGRMAEFSMRYNVDVGVHVYVQGLDADLAVRLSETVATDAVDRLGFFFDFAEASGASVGALRGELARFCGDPVVADPRVVVGNFPFCFMPANALKILYRDAVADLRGHIGAQRALAADVAASSFDYFPACGHCRCRRACYTYTEIAEHPECGEWLCPRRESTLVFAGGSLSPADVDGDEDIVWVGPAEQGDMIAAVLDGFDNILIIDGYFYTKFPCTTLEVMAAMERGVNVCGAASIGALRAAELERFGMAGTGYVFEYLKRRELKPYHVVAQTYGEGDRSLTTPLIQVVYFLDCAQRDGILGEADRHRLEAMAEGIHFTYLSFDALFSAAAGCGDLDKGMLNGLREYYATGPGRFDVKRQDAKELLRSFRRLSADRSREVVARTVEVVQRGYVAVLREKYDRTDDFALREDWRSSGGAPADEMRVARDSRDRSAAETCARARGFLEGLDVVLADTTRYDAADSYILSAFFVPFHLLDYYPSSATGNGDVFDEALASAYMELVERLCACSLDVRGRQVGELDEAPFPLEHIPQFYNWGCGAAEKARVVRERGYVAVTDIVSGRREHVPGAAVMFRYSGTDGFSAGNSLVEAVLYGLYEVVERDTCQIHLVSPECRALLPRLKIDHSAIGDACCLGLLTQLDDKGCDVVLFLLPNLYGLPCVMVHVYDRNRGVQCHGGIAVRADFQRAAYAALHEAYMQYITYFVGTRDDYRAFASAKRARISYDNARKTLLGGAPGEVAVPDSTDFGSVGAELDWVMGRLTAADIEHILVADLSPREEYGVKGARVMVPGTELWFCPDYVPSQFLAARAVRTVEAAREMF